MKENTSKPMVLIDMAKNRIRIHRTTLAALQQPEYILIIVNPEEKHIGIMPGKLSDPGVHRVKTPSVLGKNCYELYSAAFTRKLRQVCADWLPAGKYRIEGTVIPGELLVRFSMEDAVFTGTGKVK